MRSVGLPQDEGECGYAIVSASGPPGPLRPWRRRDGICPQRGDSPAPRAIPERVPPAARVLEV